MPDAPLHMLLVVRERFTRHRADWSAVWGGVFSTSVHSVLSTGISSGIAWTAFLSLFLSWLAAMGGASTKTGPKSVAPRHAVPDRPAA